MENSDDQFSLKWNNFQSNLATGFHDLLQEEDMVDVTLAAEGKILHAHKIILSVCSPYFKDLFKVNPCKHPIVILKDVGHQELADMLDFMYRGEASVRQEDLAAFLKLAETLKVKGLAGDKEDSTSNPPPQSQRKPSSLVPKKKKMVETAIYEPEEDPGDPDFNPTGEHKRKRKRVSSPQPKTENTSTSATNNSFVPLVNPKQEIQDQGEVEFLDESTNDPLVHFITGKQAKQEEEGHDFDDPNQEMTGDETHDGDMDMTAGPSNPDDPTEQVPQGSKVHAIWDFFVRDRRRGMAFCKVCHVWRVCKSSNYISNLLSHLKVKDDAHKVAYMEYVKKKEKEKQVRMKTLSKEFMLFQGDHFLMYGAHLCDYSRRVQIGFENSDSMENDPSRYYYMENQHGLPQLVYNGYVFRRDRERARFSMNRLGESVTRVRTYWRCILRSCKARGNVDPHGILRLTNEHDHPPNEEKVKYRNLRAEIKKRALEYNHPPKTILEHFNIKDESLEKTIANWRYRFGSKEGKQSTSTSPTEYYYKAGGTKIKLPLTKVKVQGKDQDWKIITEKGGNEEHLYATTTEDGQKTEGIILEEGGEEVVFQEERIIVNDDELYEIEEGSQEHFEKIYYIISKN